MHRRQTGTLSRAISPSKLMVPQREGPIAPFDIGTGTLEHFGQLLGLVGELTLLPLTQLGQHPAGLKQRRAQTFGQLPPLFTCMYCAPLGHTIARARRNAMGVQGVGHRRCQGEWPDLLVHLPRHKLDGGLHCRHHPFSVVDALPAGLPEAVVLRHATNRVNLLADSCRNEPTVAPHAALYINKVVGLADRTAAVGDRLALGTAALEVLARRVRVVGEVLQACGSLWGATWAVLFRRVARTLKLSLLEPLLCLAGRLAGGPLRGSHGAADRFDPLRLPREEGR